MVYLCSVDIYKWCDSQLYSVDDAMVVGASEPVLQHVSSHRLRPSAPWWTHRGDLSAGPAGRDLEVRMPWGSRQEKRHPGGFTGVRYKQLDFSWIFGGQWMLLTCLACIASFSSCTGTWVMISTCFRRFVDFWFV